MTMCKLEQFNFLPSGYRLIDKKKNTVFAINISDFPDKFAIWLLNDNQLECGAYFKDFHIALTEYQKRIGITAEKKHRKTKAIIDRLDSNLKIKVDEMIDSKRFTYKEVQSFLYENGIEISTSSIWRYSTRKISQEQKGESA